MRAQCTDTDHIAAMPQKEGNEMEMRHRDLSAVVRASGEERTFTAIASTDTVDSYGEAIDQASWRLERYNRNPVVLYAHDSRSLPIGVSTKIGIEAGKLVVTARLATAQANPRAEEVWNCIKEGAICGVSVGFLPKSVRTEKRNGVDVTVLADCELYEISVTPVPANPDTLIQRVKSVKAAPPRGAEPEDLASIVMRESGLTAPVIPITKQREERAHTELFDVVQNELNDPNFDGAA